MRCFEIRKGDCRLSRGHWFDEFMAMSGDEHRLAMSVVVGKLEVKSELRSSTTDIDVARRKTLAKAMMADSRNAPQLSKRRRPRLRC